VTAVITGETTAGPIYSERRARWTVGLVLCASFVVLADLSIVNLAAPVIQRSLGASISDIELTVSGYQLAYGAMLVTGGRLGDIFGRRALFSLGFAGFIAASAACGLAGSPGQLIAFRVLQGMTAGLLSPQVLATIQVVLPPSRRAAAFGALGAVLAAATILGPLISGLIIMGNFFGASWRPIFLINVPIGVIAIVAARWLLPAGRDRGAKRVDAAGTALLLALWIALMVPLTVGAQDGWPAWAWVLLAAVPALAVAFLTVQRHLAARGRDPILPPELWHDRAFRVGLGLYLALFSGIVCFFLYYSILLQSGYRLSTLAAGAGTIPAALGTLVTSVLSAKMARRWGGRRITAVGALICAVGFLTMLAPLLTVRTATLAAWLVPSLLLAGAGFGMVIAPLLSLVLAGIRSSAAGAASGLLTTSQVIGGGLGVVIMGLIFQSQVPGRLAAATAAQLGAGLSRGVLFDAATFAVAALLLRALPGPGPGPGDDARPQAGLARPPGFPLPAEATDYRRLLDAVVSGAMPPPPCVSRFALPRPSAWSYGTLRGTASPGEIETWTPGVVFGGYIACLADQFAGLVMLTVIPDGATFLTAGVSLDLRSPLRPGQAEVTARVLRLGRREAMVEVVIDQDGRTTSRATVTQVVRRATYGHTK
jgi:EmrB/QacA subfamily drug resistance transporter